MNKILVFGGIGQLGQCINKVGNERNYKSILFLDEIEGLEIPYWRHSLIKCIQELNKIE